MSAESRGEKCGISDRASCVCWPLWLYLADTETPGCLSLSLLSRRLRRPNYQARNGIQPLHDMRASQVLRPLGARKSQVSAHFVVKLSAVMSDWSTLIGPDPSRYCALIGGTLLFWCQGLCHNNTPHLTLARRQRERQETLVGRGLLVP